jgi:hypothetical protein
VLAVSRVKRPVEGTHVRRGLRTNVEVASHLEEVTERKGSIDVDIERLQRRRRRRPTFDFFQTNHTINPLLPQDLM